jgi:hypothetical protein
MKRKVLYSLLSVEFVALLALMLLTVEFPNLFSSLLAFPFEQIGVGLRALSLTGQIGNGLALAIWVGLSMLPLIPAWQHRKDKTRVWENGSYYLLSGLLLFVLYGMANPTISYSYFPEIGDSFLPVMKAILGATVWSVVVMLVIFRLLQLFRSAETNQLLGYLRTLLYALCALFTGVIALSYGGMLVIGLANMQRSMDGVMTIMHFLVSALPYVLDIAVTLSALTLLDALLSEDQSSVATYADRLSSLCCMALGITAASVVALNILQLVLSRWLSDIAVSVDIPIMSIAFVLSVLLISRLITENMRLRNDNDLFI